MPVLLMLNPAAQASQCFPSRITRTRVTGAGCLVAIYAAARTKSFAIGLAKRPGRQGQQNLFPKHVFKRKTTIVIIPDFRLRRGDCMLRTRRIHRRRPKQQIELPRQRQIHRLDTPRAGNSKLAPEAPLQPDIGHNLLRPAMLMQHLSASLSGKIAQLLRLAAIADRFGRQRHRKLNRLTLQI